MQAYVYGYPLVMMEVTRDVMTAVPAPDAEGTAAPINQFAKMPTYVSPDFKNVVRISLNGLWATAWLDLASESQVLSVPEVPRYFVMSVMDTWTNVFASFGPRTTGKGPGAFLIAGPGWRGAAPAGVQEVVRSPTRYAWILGQTQANGPDDFAAVNAVQKDYKLTPLGAWGTDYTPPAEVPVVPGIDLTRTPPDQVNGMGADEFFRRMTSAMADSPPAEEDWRSLAGMKLLGMEPGVPFDIGTADPDVADALRRSVQSVQSLLADGVAGMKNVNGWIQPANIGRYATDYETRAGIAYVGLGANQPADTIYPTAYVDSDGMPFDSAHNYVLRFGKTELPPTNGGWSLTIYQGNFYVRNAANRYAISPWMPLVYGEDGSLEIYIQADPPGADREANWLPTPASGSFNLTIRNYWPKEAVLSGTYKTPPVRRVE